MKQEILKLVRSKLPATEGAIAATTGLSRGAVHRCVVELRKDKLIHIGGWYSAPSQGPAAPIHHAGDGVDRPFVYKSKKELLARVRKYREKAKAAKLAALMRGEEVEKAPVETTVQHAMRTQPASVFSLACSA